MRKKIQTVASRDPPTRKLVRCLRVELRKIGPDGADIGESECRPNDPVQRRFGVGQGNSSGLPQDCNHCTTSACGTTRPAAKSASASVSSRASVASSGGRSKIDLCLDVGMCGVLWKRHVARPQPDDSYPPPDAIAIATAPPVRFAAPTPHPGPRPCASASSR